MSDHALFAVAPFVSILVLVVAATLRTRHDTSVSARPSPSSAPALRLAAKHPLPAIGFLGVLLGHVVMVAWPDQLLRWNRDLPRLIAFELALFTFGAAALAGVAAAIRCRVLRRLLLTIVSGLGIAIVYRWAAAWSAVTVTRYARSVLSLQPNVGPLEAMPYLVKLHIFSGFMVVALLAFTRSFDFLLDAVLRAARVVIGPCVSTVDRLWTPLHERALRSGRSLMWPEEED